MHLAYATTDEVNQDLAARLAAACGAVVCHFRPGDAPPDGLFDAFLYDLDDVPSDQRRALLEELWLNPPARRVAVPGYGIADEQAAALRRRRVTVAERLHTGLFRSLCKAVRPSRATVPAADSRADLTCGPFDSTSVRIRAWSAQQRARQSDVG